MVVRSSRGRVARVPPAVVWHELECGAYDADLALWPGEVLDDTSILRVPALVLRAGRAVAGSLL